MGWEVYCDKNSCEWFKLLILHINIFVVGVVLLHSVTKSGKNIFTNHESNKSTTILTHTKWSILQRIVGVQPFGIFEIFR